MYAQLTTIAMLMATAVDSISKDNASHPAALERGRWLKALEE